MSNYDTKLQTIKQADANAIESSFITGLLLGSATYIRNKTSNDNIMLTLIKASVVGIISAVSSAIVCSITPSHIKAVVPFVGGFAFFVVIMTPPDRFIPK